MDGGGAGSGGVADVPTSPGELDDEWEDRSAPAASFVSPASTRWTVQASPEPHDGAPGSSGGATTTTTTTTTTRHTVVQTSTVVRASGEADEDAEAQAQASASTQRLFGTGREQLDDVAATLHRLVDTVDAAGLSGDDSDGGTWHAIGVELGLATLVVVWWHQLTRRMVCVCARVFCVRQCCLRMRMRPFKAACITTKTRCHPLTPWWTSSSWRTNSSSSAVCQSRTARRQLLARARMVLVLVLMVAVLVATPAMAPHVMSGTGTS